VTNLTFAGQIYVKNAFTAFHKNLTDGLAAETRSRTDGRGLHVERYCAS